MTTLASQLRELAGKATPGRWEAGKLPTHFTMDDLNLQCALVNALPAILDALEDAERYRARRNYEWCDYDDYCNSVMPRDGSATRQNFDQWHADYDANSDSMLEDYSETFPPEANLPGGKD